MISGDSAEEQARINALYEALIVEPWRADAESEMHREIEELRKLIVEEPKNATIVATVLDALKGIDEPRAQIIRASMEQSLIMLQFVDEESSKVKADVRKKLDVLLYDFILKKFVK